MKNTDKENIYKELKEFLKKDGYDIKDDPNKRNSQVDVEASWICHAIWETLINVPYTDSPDTDSSLVADHMIETIIWGNYMIWKGREDRENRRFHFDIMNNPKEYNNSFSCGLFSIMDPPTRKDCLNIYHNIGNMAPIPWFIPNGTKAINSQSLHKSLDERWDLYLRVLRSFWSEWSMEWEIGFEEYMKKTCQQMYFCIPISGSIPDSKGNEIRFNNIDTMPEEEYKEFKEGIDPELINKWDKYIDEYKDETPKLELVSFSHLSDGGCKSIGIKIKRLIEIRNIVIKTKLKQYIFRDNLFLR